MIVKNPELIRMAQEAIEKKPRAHVQLHQLLSVVMQESSGNPLFDETSPGSLYYANMMSAVTYYKRKKLPDGRVIRLGPFHTGFVPADIRRMVTIPKVIGKWSPPEALQGKIAKFRFEYGYWESRNLRVLPPEQRFLMSCSWGVVQFMGPNISSKGDVEFVRRFAADIPLQLLYGAGMVDDLLKTTKGDLFRAYKAYNSGNADSENPEVIARAKLVVTRAKTIEAELRGRKNV